MDDYLEDVKEYRNNPAMLTSAKELKECADDKLTGDDKNNILNVLVGLTVCVGASGACLGVCSSQGDLSSPCGPCLEI